MTIDDDMKLREYDALRTELRENKRFIFERAVIAVIAILAIMESIKGPMILILPTAGIGLLMYNLLFTTTRFRSSAHIVAILARFHEGDLKTRWIGWENYLYWYRRLEKDKGAEAIKASINQEFDSAIKSKHLFNYHRIFYFHLFAIIGFIGMPILYKSGLEETHLSDSCILAMILGNVVLTTYLFLRNCKNVRPKHIVTSIEYYYIACGKVIEYHDSERK